MSLTNEDLGKIQSMFDGVAMKADLERFATKADLTAELDRMESRIITSIGLLERDTYSRLDQHEHRITQLEKSRA